MVSDLRVLSGSLKGLPIKSPRDSATHPMGSRERLALFNMLNSYLVGASVLDLYAGTGALGIEALSRGAKRVTFVEKSAAVTRLIRENLQSLEGKGFSYEVCAENVVDFVQKAETAGDYDLVIADPPYDKFAVQEVELLGRPLKTGGVLALSFPFTAGIPEISGLKVYTVRKYAAAGIALYQKTSLNY